MYPLLEKLKSVLLPINTQDLQPARPLDHAEHTDHTEDLVDPISENLGNERTADAELLPCAPVQCGPECMEHLAMVPIVIIPADLFNALRAKMRQVTEDDPSMAYKMYGDLGQIVVDLLDSVQFPETEVKDD